MSSFSTMKLNLFFNWLKKHPLTVIFLLLFLIACSWSIFEKIINNKYFCENVRGGKHECYSGPFPGCSCDVRYKYIGKSCTNSDQCHGGKCLAQPEQIEYANKETKLNPSKNIANPCNYSETIKLPENLKIRGSCGLPSMYYDWEIYNGAIKYLSNICQFTEKLWT